jgi:hypothetical protein
MLKPSNIALIASGLLIALGLFLLYIELIKGNSISNTKIIDLVLFLSTAISLHGLLHMGAEIHYNYNPIEGNLFY